MESNENNNMADKDPLEGSSGFSGIYRSMVVRDPSKRKVKPVEDHLQLLDFGDLDDSSDDSDFKIGDHAQESNEDSGESSGGNDDNSEEEYEDQGEAETQEKPLATEEEEMEEKPKEIKSEFPEIPFQEDVKVKIAEPPTKKLKVLICSVCLGDVSLLPITITRQGEKMLSEEEDEIVECDSCGISVHEGCYGISDSDTAVSTVSSYSTEPWFCDACKAGNTDPVCELCPNTGGIFKETDVGKWVHLVCALYIPGVAFGDVDKLSPVTLFEMPYSRWGAKACSLCEDDRFSRTGVCINCDAGMCRNYFHVTCAQKEGLLSKASTEEDIADPFFAYCKLHSDKALSRNKKRNYLALQSQSKGNKLTSEPESEEKKRIERKLGWHRGKYLADKEKRPQPWVPTQKMPRLLTTSPSACKKLLKKAELLGLSPETHMIAAELMDIRRKWHVPPAFTTEFISYYIDRNIRMVSMQHRFDELIQQNSKLQEQEQGSRSTYERIINEVELLRKENAEMMEVGMRFWRMLSDFSGEKYPLPEALKPKPLVKSTSKNKKTDSSGSVIMECGICHKSHDQHQLAKCDSCQLHYHLACLDPPLSRMPKKTKSLGWQCSECDKTENDEQVDEVDPDAPRKLRHGKGGNQLPGPEKSRRGRSRKRGCDGSGTEEKSSEIWISSGNEEDPDAPESPKPRAVGRKKRRSTDLGYRKTRRRGMKRRVTRESWTEDDVTNEEQEVKMPRHSTRRTSSN